MLGWAITVMGCELPSSMEEEREYLRCRWTGLHGLGLKHSFRAAELLEVSSPIIWVNGTRKCGDGRIGQKKLGGPHIQGPQSSLIGLTSRFQDVSRDLGWELVLI